MSGPLVTQKPNTDERCATLKLYPLSAHPHQTAWIHPWVCPDTTQLGPHKTHNMPPCRARQTPACTNLLWDESPGAHGESQRGGVRGQTQRRGPWPMSRLADCCRVRLSCCCQRARAEGDTLKLPPFCLPKTPSIQW